MDSATNARARFTGKLNCAESTCQALCEALDLDPSLARSASAFGGGGVHEQLLCGAVAGAMIAIGALKGRLLPSEDRFVGETPVIKLIQRVREKYGDLTCRNIIGLDFKAVPQDMEERARRREGVCTQIVGDVTQWALEILAEE